MTFPGESLLSDISVVRYDTDVLIVGGGPCGLGAAWRFSTQNSGKSPSFLLFDNHDRPGGWARSVRKDGFTFDFGLRLLQNRVLFWIPKGQGGLGGG